MSADDLNTLLESRRWVRRRVDRVEFLDLVTVRRTIALTLNLGAFADAQPLYGRTVIPLGWSFPGRTPGRNSLTRMNARDSIPDQP
jgi:hypothetical protein